MIRADRDAIRRVNEAAFGRPGEADLIDALRGTPGWLPELSPYEAPDEAWMALPLPAYANERGLVRCPPPWSAV